MCVLTTEVLKVLDMTFLGNWGPPGVPWKGWSQSLGVLPALVTDCGRTEFTDPFLLALSPVGTDSFS